MKIVYWQVEFVFFKMPKLKSTPRVYGSTDR